METKIWILDVIYLLEVLRSCKIGLEIFLHYFIGWKLLDSGFYVLRNQFNFGSGGVQLARAGGEDQHLQGPLYREHKWGEGHLVRVAG